MIPFTKFSYGLLYKYNDDEYDDDNHDDADEHDDDEHGDDEHDDNVHDDDSWHKIDDNICYENIVIILVCTFDLKYNYSATISSRLLREGT